MSAQDQSYTIKEAAQLLKVSPITLRRWDKAGVLVPGRTLGGQRRYTQQQITDFNNRKGEELQNLLSIQEASDKLGVSSTTLRRWDNNGSLTARRTNGGQRRYEAKNLYVANNNYPRLAAELPKKEIVKLKNQPLLYILPFLLLISVLTLFFVVLPYVNTGEKSAFVTAAEKKILGLFALGKNKLSLDSKITLIGSALEFDKGTFDSVTSQEISVGEAQFSDEEISTGKDNFTIESLGQINFFGPGNYISSEGSLVAQQSVSTKALYGEAAQGGDLYLYATIDAERGNIHLNSANTYVNALGIYHGNGSGLSNLNASNVSSGTLSFDRLAQVTSAQIQDGTITGADISADSLDFTSFSDTLNLDAGTSVTFGAYDFTFNFSSTGNFIIQDSGTTFATFDDDGTVTFTGLLTVGGDVAVNGGDVTTTATTFNLINATATTVNFAGAGTAVSIGATTGTTTVKNDLSVNGTGLVAGILTLSHAPTLAHTGTWAQGSATWNQADAPLYINPASATADSNLLGIAVAGSVKFSIDAEGDIYARNLILTGSTSTGTTTVAGDLTVEGNTTLGDTTTDTLTVNPATLTWAGGNKTIDITGAATRTLTLLNSTASQVADLDLSDGDLKLGGTVRISNAGVGTFITGTVIGSQTFTTNNIVDSGALTITSTTNALTLDSGSGSIALSSDSLTGVGTGITANAGLTINTAGTTGTMTIRTADQSAGSTNSTALNIITGNAAGATSTAGNIVLDVGTSTTSNGSILIGTAARAQTITIGNSTGGTITVGATSGSDLVLNDAQWSVTGAGVATFASVSTGAGAISGGAGSFTTLTSSGNTTLATGTSTTNTFGSGASSVNTIGSTTTPGALTLHGATTLDNTFTVSGSNLTSLGGNLTVTGTAWTATPTISGLVTMTSGFDSNSASTVAGLTVDGDGNLTVSNGTLSVTAPTTTGNAGAVIANSLTTGTGLDISSTSTAGGASGVSKLLNLTRSGANAQLAHTAYGIYSTVTNTNVTSGTNIAGYFSASGATTANYGLIVANGDVGIGDTAPSTKLALGGSGSANGITFGDDAASPANLYRGGADILQTDDNVSITGTANPVVTLDGSATSAVALRLNYGGAATFGGYIGLESSTGGALITGSAARTLAIRGDSGVAIGGGNRQDIYIDTAGDVGIGTASPDTRLHVQQSGSAGYNAIVSNGALTTNANITLGGGDAGCGGTGTGFIGIRINGSGSGLCGGAIHTRLRLETDRTTVVSSSNGNLVTFLNSGSVGIGTTAPGGLLDVGGSFTTTDTNNFFSRFNPSPTATQNISLWANLAIDGPTIAGDAATRTLTSAASLYIEGAPAAGANAAITNAYALWVDAGNARFDGDVGIGTTSPGRTLDVTGNWGGNALTNAQTNCTTTQTTSTEALAYDLSNTDSDGSGSPKTCTFNITGLPDTDGTFAFIATRTVLVNASGGSSNTVVVQINGVQVSSVARTTNGTTVENYVIARTNSAWRIIGTPSTSDSADIAEWYPVSSASETSGELGLPESGDIVVMEKGEEVAQNPDSQAPDSKITALVKSYKKQQSTILGVVSTKPAISIGQDFDMSALPVRQLALSGRVITKVSTENGPIMAGDAITSSSTPGVGMKATKPGQIVGRALESFDCHPEQSEGSLDSSSSTQNDICSGKILVFVNPSWYDPDVYLTSTGDFNIAPSIDELVAQELNQEAGSTNQDFPTEAAVVQTAPIKKYDLKAKDNTVVERIGAFSKAIFGNVESGITKTKSLLAEDIQADSVKAKDASFESVKIGDKLLVDYIQETASGSATLSPIATFSAALLDTQDSANTVFNGKNATVSGTLSVLGRTTMNDLGVTGNISAGVISIHGLEGEINALSLPLKLQSYGFSGIEFLGGKAAIDKDGNFSTEGGLASKTVQTEELQVLGDSIGSGIIAAENTKVVIDTTKAGENSKIFVTPRSKTGQRQLYVGEIVNGASFTVEIEQAYTADISFDWWVVN